MSECACCGTSPPDSQIDFHHWQYNDEEPGCHLCRECHNRVHGGMTVRRQDMAASWSWKRDAVENLIELCNEYNLPVSGADDLCKRFNIPDNVSREHAEKLEGSGGLSDIVDYPATSVDPDGGGSDE